MTDEKKPTGMLLEAVFGSEAIDSSGEMLSVKGADITDLEDGVAQVNYEHFNDEQSDSEREAGLRPSGNDWVGRIVFAKKIFGPEDCSNDRQLAFWNELEVPFIYGIVRLYDRAGHPGAQALAAAIRDHHANKEKILWRWSVEGTTLKTSKDKKELLESVVRVVALTRKPCNRSAETRVLADPNAPEGFDAKPVKFEKGVEELKRSEHQDPTKTQLGAASYIYYDPRLPEDFDARLLKGWQEDQAIERDAVESHDPSVEVVGRPHAGPAIPPLNTHKITGTKQPISAKTSEALGLNDRLTGKKLRTSSQVVGNEQLVPGKTTHAQYQRAAEVSAANRNQRFREATENGQEQISMPHGPFDTREPGNVNNGGALDGRKWDTSDQFRFWAQLGHEAFHAANPIPPMSLDEFPGTGYDQATRGTGPGGAHRMGDSYRVNIEPGSKLEFQWRQPHVGAGGGTGTREGWQIMSRLVHPEGVYRTPSRHALWSASGTEHLPYQVQVHEPYETLAPALMEAARQHLQNHLQQNPKQLPDYYDTWKAAGYYTNPQQGLHMKSEPDLSKTITAGNYNAAPGSLSGGAALQVEDLGLRARAKAALRDHRPSDGDFRKFLKARLPEASDAFVDRFNDLVEDYKFKKSQLLMAKAEKPDMGAVIRKLEAMTIDLKKMAKRGLAAGKFTKPEPEAPLPAELQYQGRRVKPGAAKMHEDGSTLAVLATHPDHHVAVRLKPGSTDWAPEDMLKLSRTDSPSRYSLKSKPEDIEASPIVDAAKHGTAHLNTKPAQTQMIQGLDFSKIDRAKTGFNSATSAWAMGGHGKPVYVKDAGSLYDMPGTFDATHREAVFHNLAHDFFGMGEHVPTTAHVRHPRTGSEMSVTDKISGEHVPTNEFGGPGRPEHDAALDSQKRAGTLDKALVMDTVMGMPDRHGSNWMLGDDKKLKLLDHGLTLNQQVPGNAHAFPTYLLHGRKDPMTPSAAKWALQLRPEELQKQLQAHGTPPEETQAAVRRLFALQGQLQMPQPPSRLQAYTQARAASAAPTE